DALRRRTTFEYDAAGRLIRTTFPDLLFETRDYDEAGNLVLLVDQGGRATRYEYDRGNRLTATILPDDTPADPPGNPRTRTEYDAADRVVAEIDASGNRTDYEYDRAGRRTRTLLPEVFDGVSGTSRRPEVREEYNAAGRRTAVVDAGGKRTEYRY